jgi:probable F420-dependent oxidoreductase
MQVGLFVFETAYSLDTAVLAKHAEDVGFESFLVPEHPVIPGQTTSPYRGSADGVLPDAYKRIVDPFIALVWASAVTTTIKLGTGICLVPEHNPLMLAKTIATLDHYSGGRFIFGIGAGWLKEETEVMGGDFPHRWTQTREAILAMKELWTRDEAEYHGQDYNLPPLLSFPKPVQKPHPPIFLGGTARHVFSRIAEWGDGWMPNRIDADTIRRGRNTLN